MPRKDKLPAGIYKLPNDKYAVRPYDTVAGKKGRQFSSFDLQEVIDYKNRVETGQKAAGTRQWTCDEWVEHWTTHPGFKRRKETTNVHNAERVRKFAEDFAGVAIYAVDRKQARAWSMKDNNLQRVAAVRAMFNDAIEEGVLADNPFRNIKISRGAGRKHIKPMTPAEVQKLADTAGELWPDWPVLSNMILFASYSGVRRGELLALRWSDIDFAKGTILVERAWQQATRSIGTPKNGQARVAPLFEQAALALRNTERHMSPEDDLIWYSSRGKKIEPALLDYYWRQARQRFFGQISAARIAEIDLEWHTLRHFYVSWLVDKGAQPHDIAAAVGHTDGGRLVQELYGHLYTDNSISRLQQAVIAA